MNSHIKQLLYVALPGSLFAMFIKLAIDGYLAGNTLQLNAGVICASVTATAWLALVIFSKEVDTFFEFISV